MIDSQSAAIRKAMMLDAEWQHADAKFFAACEVPDTGPSQSRRQWQRRSHSRPISTSSAITATEKVETIQGVT